MENIHYCKNCEAEVDLNYCKVCGQMRVEERWNMKKLLQSAFSAVFNLEKGFFFTFKNMVVHPGKVVREYLDGRTMPYTNPFRYALLGIAISVFLSLSLGVWETQVDQIIETYRKIGMIDDAASEERMRKVFAMVTKFMNFIPLLLLPFIAFSLKLFFKKQRFNYAEYFIAVAFLTGQASIYGVLVSLAVFLVPSLISIMFIVGVLIAVIVYGQAFRELFHKSWIESFALALAAYLTGFAFFFIFVFAITAIATIIAIAVIKFFKF